MADENSHPPIWTHKKKKKKKFPQPSLETLFDQPGEGSAHAAPRVDMFPNQVGIYPHGTLEKGYEQLLKEKEDPLNTDRASREMLNELEGLYVRTISKSEILHPGRRFLSKSGESRETGGGSEHPQQTLIQLAQKIFPLEIAFQNHKSARASKSASIDSNLLQAIEVANKAILLNSMGDYWGALCHDFRDNMYFQKPSKQGQWAFLGFSKYSDLIKEYDKQKEELELYNQLPAASKGQPPNTKLIDSLQEAAVYLKDQYDNVDEIVRFMRQYANRNMTVHPVKTYFEEGNYVGLRRKILRDYRNFTFLGSDELSEGYKSEVKTTLELVVKRFYLQWSWDEDGFAKEGPALQECRRIYEEKQKKTIPFFGKKGFEEESKGKGKGKGEEKDKTTAKGDHTWEASMEEEAVKNEEMKKDAAYQKALSICKDLDQGYFLESVLKETMESYRKEKEAAEDATKMSNEYFTKWNSAMDANKRAKDKSKEKIKKLNAEIAELKAELEACKE